MNNSTKVPGIPGQSPRFYSAQFVKAELGYRNAGAFFDAVRRHGIPHVRINARRIVFPVQQYNDWLARRNSTGKAVAA